MLPWPRVALATLLLLSTVAQGASPAVALKWAPASRQFLLENLAPSRVETDSDPHSNVVESVVLDGDAVRIFGSEGREKWSENSLNGELGSRFRVSVEATRPGAMFAVGLASDWVESDVERRWMVDFGNCLWYMTGKPDRQADMDGDRLWGSFGRDGCMLSETAVMDVDLETGVVRFFSGKGDEDPSGSQQQLLFSLNGFNTINLKTLEETRDHVQRPQSLLINGVSFDFELSNFGPDLWFGESVRSVLVEADPLNACKPLKGRNYRGKVVYAWRGGCDFLDKVLNAQNMGAIAVIVADNNNKGVSNSREKSDLVIMDQFNRNEDASKVNIPSVFVSRKAREFIKSQKAMKAQIGVVLKGAIYAPAHHGPHWSEVAPKPNIAVAPGSEVLVRVSKLEQAVEIAPHTSLCRNLLYYAVAFSERRAVQAFFSEAQSASSSSKIPVQLSKRLVAEGVVCNENVTKDSFQAFESSISLLADDEVLFSSDLAQDVGADLETGWGLSQAPKFGQNDLLRTNYKTCLKEVSVDTFVSDEDDPTLISVGNARNCAFTFTVLDADSELPVQAPPSRLSLASFRIRRMYFWTVNLRPLANSTTQVIGGSIGIVAAPNTEDGLAWGISTSNGPILFQETQLSISSSNEKVMKALEWSEYAGVLVDFTGEQYKLILFTSPDHSCWIEMKLKVNLERAQPVLDRLFETSIANDFGIVPFVTLPSQTSVTISKMRSAKWASKIDQARRAKEAIGVQCTELKPDLRVCVPN